MTNTVKLQKTITEKGLKYVFIANKLGLSPYGLKKKIKNETEFKASEIAKLTSILGLSVNEKEDIFFAN